MTATTKNEQTKGSGSDAPICSRRGIDWFSRGRDAFTEGKPCAIDDLRMSRSNIQDWYAGWNHQAALNGRKNLNQDDVDDVIHQIEEDRKALLRERARELAGENDERTCADS